MKNEDLTSLLKQKSQENSIMNRFRFEKCDKDFESKSELEKLEESGKAHIKEHVDLLCGTCGHKFINIQKLKTSTNVWSQFLKHSFKVNYRYDVIRVHVHCSICLYNLYYVVSYHLEINPIIIIIIIIIGSS